MILYRENRITKEDVAKVLDTSTDYVDWLLDKIFPRHYRKPDELKQGEINSVVPQVPEGTQPPDGNVELRT
jgi:hypothetical protein